MNLRAAFLVLLLPSTVAAQAPSRAAVVAAATDIIQKAHYCTFITLDEDGQPQARIVDPIAPDANFTIWFATNPLTRKVDQVRRNPRVTMSCFDAGTSSYVTVLGRGDLVTDVAEKQRQWKPDWAAIYPNGAKSSDFILIRITPARLEIVSESRRMIGDAKTWLPLAIDFPANQPPVVAQPNGSKRSLDQLSGPPGALRDQDSTGIEAATRRFLTAFNNLDMPAFLDRFAEDATIIHPPSVPPRTFPTRLQGKEEIQRTFQVVFDQIRSASNRTTAPYQDLQPRDLLIQGYDGLAVLTFHLGSEKRVGRRTLVLRRIGADWKIVHLHASTFELP